MREPRRICRRSNGTGLRRGISPKALVLGAGSTEKPFLCVFSICRRRSRRHRDGRPIWPRCRAEKPRRTPMPPAPRGWISRKASIITVAKANQAVSPSRIARKLHVRMRRNTSGFPRVTAMAWAGHRQRTGVAMRKLNSWWKIGDRRRAWRSLAARPCRPARVPRNDGGISRDVGGDRRRRGGLSKRRQRAQL